MGESETDKPTEFSPEDFRLYQRLYRNMLRIRRVQERIESLYLEDSMKTPVHLCVGQEAVAVGVCEALDKDDYISSNHRGHGHYLAKGGDLRSLIAELHCKKTGCSKGYGGSMHLIDTRVGHMGSSAIVGGGIPIGTGMALAEKLRGTHRVSVVFFGDGAADEGVFYESVNFAMLWKLPVVYVLENNQWSVCSRACSRRAGRNIFHGANRKLLFSAEIDGNDVVEVFKTARFAVDRAREAKGPSLIECHTYRIVGHAGCRKQDPKGYRSETEIESWKRKCPLDRLEKRIANSGLLLQEQIGHWENQIKSEIDEAFEYARQGPLPEPEDLDGFLFRE